MLLIVGLCRSAGSWVIIHSAGCQETVSLFTSNDQLRWQMASAGCQVGWEIGSWKTRKTKTFCFNNLALHDYFKKQMLPEKNFTLHSLVKLYEILLDRKIKIRNNPNPYILWLTPFPQNNKRNTLKVPLKTSRDKLGFTEEFIHRI